MKTDQAQDARITINKNVLNIFSSKWESHDTFIALIDAAMPPL